MAITTKICRFCGEEFQPYYRLIQRQYACSKPDCQRIRQKVNQIDWLERHPNYYKNWYQDYGKAWYHNHPAYQPKYRHRRNAMQQNHQQRLASVTAPFHLITWVVWGKRKLTSWSLQLTNGTTIYFIKAQNVAVLPLQL
jgi:hypothetical protein